MQRQLDYSRRLLLLLACCCGLFFTAAAQTADRQAGPLTRNLYRNLQRQWGKYILFGHQDDLAYGVDWKYQDGKSDVRSVTGDYPALMGWDLAGLERGSANNIDGIPFSKMREYMLDTYRKGGLNTLSWHLDNPYTGKNAWDTTGAAVPSILPGGKNHLQYTRTLDKIAGYMASLTDGGKPIPILFRPFHECTGDWFWWGAKHCSDAQFIALYRFTFSYLKDKKHLHNLIYMYNPADFSTEAEYLARYPGADYTDILSFDSYQYGEPGQGQAFVAALRKRLDIQQQIAVQQGKIAAIGETGYVAIPDPQWWTGVLYKAMQGYKISSVLLWRNAGYRPVEKDQHYYVPYKGQVSAADFLDFYRLPEMMFLKKAGDAQLYR